MKFEDLDPARQNKVALELAQGALRTGALPGLQFAINLRNDTDSSNQERWSEILETEERWRKVESLYGRGATLNFDHPLIAKLSDQAGAIRIPSDSAKNAERYRAALRASHTVGPERARPAGGDAS